MANLQGNARRMLQISGLAMQAEPGMPFARQRYTRGAWGSDVRHVPRLAMIAQKDFTEALVAQIPALRRYAVALAGNAALADDLVQDSIERALRQSAQLREPGRLPGWLRRILHNLYIDEIRRRRTGGKQEDITELANHMELSVPAPESLKTRDFLKTLNSLSFEHRQILLLAGLEDLNYREMAAELDIPIGTVMSRLARARERLRAIMEGGVSAEIVVLQPRHEEKA
jgi:RNA polymerase sigma-70 factor (ECF subfamily)